jgi:hypothetical protein
MIWPCMDMIISSKNAYHEQVVANNLSDYNQQRQ